MFIIVPDHVRDAINRKLDEKLFYMPEAEIDRELFYNQLLGHYEAYGVIPDFTIERNFPRRAGQ